VSFQDQCIARPPETFKSSPVVEAEASEAKKTAAAATSSGGISRRSGVDPVASSWNCSYVMPAAREADGCDPPETLAGARDERRAAFQHARTHRVSASAWGSSSGDVSGANSPAIARA